MTKEEVLKLALEALEEINKLSIGENAICLPAEIDTAMDAIKEALAQPEQEQLMSDQINYGMSVTQNGKRIDPMSIYKEPEQEPVTWRYKIVDVFGRPAWTLKTPKSDTRVLESQPLYTTPPQRKPLTAMEVYDVVHDADLDWHTGFALGEDENRFVVFARAIEAAHGIKDET